MHASLSLAFVFLLTPSLLFAAAEDRPAEGTGTPAAAVAVVAAEVPETPTVIQRLKLTTAAILRVSRPAVVMLPPLSTPQILSQEFPMIGMVQRRLGTRFNTTESSHVDAFAVCYHLSDRLGVQVIPGNSAPPRMGASMIANNTGVTVGMTVRLRRQK